jgi:hypothetical protein
VVDDALNLVDHGVEGELLIGGPGVAKGYLRRDDLTAEKFIPNPFDPEGHDRVLYRSGDAVALDHKGDILFRGRIDDQVKIRGFRVELGEIEAKLLELEGVAQATVVLRNDDGLDQLVAFVTSNGAAFDPRELRIALRHRLPAYMTPSRFELLTELPRLPSGKANRNALKKQPLSAAPDMGDEQEEPRTETEARLLEAAKSVLPPQAIPFDEIWRDTCVLLGSPIARGARKREIADLLAPLEESLGSKALLEGDRFFIQMAEPSIKVEADLVAEGYRKLTMVARLIANGSLDTNSMLFWDEPEANLNPRLIRRLAPLLLDLADAGVQVFIATHSLFLMRALELERHHRSSLKAVFIGLKATAEGVTVKQGPSLTQSGDIIALTEDIQQAEQLLDQAMGVLP